MIYEYKYIGWLLINFSHFIMAGARDRIFDKEIKNHGC